MSPRRCRALVLAVVAAAAAPPAAGAAVRVDARQVRLDSASGAVVIRRAPFGLRFTDATGRTVLREVAGGGPQSLAPTFDPEPFALALEDDRTAYRPLGFLVGSERAEQWTGSFWAGNVLRRRRTGTWQSARRVTRVLRRGAGVRLAVASTDPRRGLEVDVQPVPGGFSVRARVRGGGVVSMADAFASGATERFHGLGGRHSGTDLRGQLVPSWVEQENFGGPAYTTAAAILPPLLLAGTGRTLADLGLAGTPATLPGGAEHAIFPGGPNAAYSVSTHLVSSRGYGLTLDQPEYARWRLASDRARAWQVDVSAPRLRYTVRLGGAERVIRAQTAASGRQRLGPAWAQGATLWRLYRADGSETPATYRRSIERDLADIDRLRPPLTAYAFEGWANLSEAFVRTTIARLRARRIHTILYVRAYFADDVLGTQRPALVAEVRRRGLVATDASGRPATFGVPGLDGGATLLDPTNPAAVRLWERELRRMLDLGADGFMQDFGEATLDAMRFHDGSTGATMHNRYPVLLHRMSRRFLTRYEAEHPARGPIFMFTRASFTGSARYENASFPGDETTNWEQATGLRSLVPDMLNRAVGGQFGFTTDIGGYADRLDGPPDDELFTRWSELAALTPFFRVHNSADAGTRRPWDFAPATYRRWLALARLHARAVPYIRRLWAEGRRTGIPPTRPLWLGRERDRVSAGQDQEWLLGDDVLVAPVVRRGATGREVRLPAGCWRREGTGAAERGPLTRWVAAPLGVLAYWVRCGTRPF